MRYYKLINDGYVISIGKGGLQGVEITKEEYDSIRNVISTAPSEDGYNFRLKEDMTWEKIVAEVAEVDATTDAEYVEACKILLGVSE